MKHISLLSAALALSGCASMEQEPSAHIDFYVWNSNSLVTGFLGGGGEGDFDLMKGQTTSVRVGSPFPIRRCEAPNSCKQAVVTITNTLRLLSKVGGYASVQLDSHVQIGRQSSIRSPTGEITETINDGVPLIDPQDFHVTQTLELEAGNMQTVELIPEAHIEIRLP